MNGSDSDSSDASRQPAAALEQDENCLRLWKVSSSRYHTDGTKHAGPCPDEIATVPKEASDQHGHGEHADHFESGRSH